MPELPEVETLCRSLKPHVLNKPIARVIVHQPQLRWPVPKNLGPLLTGEIFYDLKRRGKYLLFFTARGTVIAHLGLSGRLLVLDAKHKKDPHEHLTIYFTNQKSLCLIDPRRFGAFLWTQQNPYDHPLLKNLGPEPLTKKFNSHFLVETIKRHKVPIKQFLMDSHIIAGIGNIYANEALFAAKINPLQPANSLGLDDCERLVKAIKKTLKLALRKGGTTIKDFLDSEGKKGLFQQRLMVYGRGGEKCKHCATKLKEIRLANRSTVFCPKCQKIK